MNIVLISAMTGCPWGGSEELWADMGEVALGEKHRLLVCRTIWPTEPAKLRCLREKGARVLPLPPPNWPWPQPFQPLFDFRPDVICVNQGATYDVVWHPQLAHFLLNLSVPYVMICHGNIEGHISDGSSRERAAALFARAYRVAFVAASIRNATERQLARAITNACMVKNPVNLESADLVPWPASSSVRLACLARLECRTKGQDLLFEALSESEWDGNDWQLNLFGDGPDRQYLEALAQYYRIADRVCFHGHVSDVSSIWRENHLLVLPSRTEARPLALVEAMLCGRAAVVTDVGDNTKTVADGVTGFVAEAPTARSLRNALKRAWAEKANWREMGLRAKAAAEASHEREPGRRLLELLTEAVKGRPAAPVTTSFLGVAG
jgi:glycosyltransferase involved in cell wall biosynthesis